MSFSCAGSAKLKRTPIEVPIIMKQVFLKFLSSIIVLRWKIVPITNPKNTVNSVKRFMGKKFSEINEEKRNLSYEVEKGSKY